MAENLTRAERIIEDTVALINYVLENKEINMGNISTLDYAINILDEEGYIFDERLLKNLKDAISNLKRGGKLTKTMEILFLYLKKVIPQAALTQPAPHGLFFKSWAFGMIL